MIAQTKLSVTLGLLNDYEDDEAQQRQSRYRRQNFDFHVAPV